MKQLRADGKTDRDIAREIGCSSTTVAYHLGPSGIHRGRNSSVDASVRAGELSGPSGDGLLEALEDSRSARQGDGKLRQTVKVKCRNCNKEYDCPTRNFRTVTRCKECAGVSGENTNVSIGSSFGNAITVSERYYVVFPSGRKAYVDVLCNCGRSGVQTVAVTAKNVESWRCDFCLKESLTEKRLVAVRQIVPLGSTWGRLTVIEEIGSLPESGNSYRSRVKVQCSCANKTIKFVRVSGLLFDKTQSCGCLHDESARERNTGANHWNWKGDFHPRQPSWYLQKVLATQGNVCAWPPCNIPFSEDDNLNVDHNHLCCPSGGTCGTCIRGVVHAYCNMRLITAVDYALTLGATPDCFPPEVAEYITRGLPDVEGKQGEVGEAFHTPPRPNS